jgi:uncharacterized Zn finger protein
MSRPPREEAEETREHLAREIARRRAGGEPLSASTAPKSGHLCRQFWGRAWCRHLQDMTAYEGRLAPGRTCLRQGRVFDLSLQPGEVRAIVADQRLHTTRLHIRPLEAETWNRLQQAAAASAPSLLDLLAGRLGEDLLRLLCDPDHGLFPCVDEIRFDCDCTDDAEPCQHAAAVFYAVGLELDARPEALFLLRGADPTVLLAEAARDAGAGLAADATDLATQNLGSLFGIDLDPAPEPPR